AVDADPVAPDPAGDVLPGRAREDCPADRIEACDDARMHRRALVNLRAVVSQQLPPHRLLRRLDLAVPVPGADRLLSDEGDEHAGDDDDELAHILAPVAPRTFRRLARSLRHEAPSSCSLSENGGARKI